MVSPLLIVEDTATLSTLYETVLNKAGYPVITAQTAETGWRCFEAEKPHVVVLDLMLPDGDGLSLMDRMRQQAPETKIVVVTANSSVNLAVSAMQAGAIDFLVKPFEADRLLKAVANAYASLPRELRPEVAIREGAETFHSFIGTSPDMQKVFDAIELTGRSNATVFITGESGTGKELCAEAIHNVSPRAARAFVPLNCGAIPTDLLESEVFGHLKGSFTGAVSDKEGAAVAADGGTLFLDEICEMDLSLQTKLLRFIQSSTVQPVGATMPRKVDVRILCATNRDPHVEVNEGRFRADLFYRLHVVPIHMPPLRDRGEDVILIAEKLLKVYAAEEGRSFVTLSEAVKNVFRRHHWPGNIRQLLNVIRNVVVLNDGGEVTSEMLPPGFWEVSSDSMQRAAQSTDTGPRPMTASQNDPIAALIGSPLSDIERRVIEATIKACDGSVTKAAHLLDVSPSTLYRKRESWK